MQNKFLALVLIIGLMGVVAPVHAEQIPCHWKCSFDQDEDDGTVWDYSEDICFGAFTDGTIGPEIPKGSPHYGGQEWQGQYLGTDWSGWWHNILDYCVERGIWTNATRNGSWPGELRYGPGNTVSFQVASGGPDIESEDLDLDGCNEGEVCIRGRSLQTVTRTMNSPFLYFENFLDGEYSVRIKSDSESFETDPVFNAENGWNVAISNKQLTVNNEGVDHLFYELETLGVTLSLNGRSFVGSDALYDYLENGDFFDRLGFTATEKQNSIGYVRDNLPEKQHYYLTILDEEAVTEIGELEVGALENGERIPVLRKYFAIYPTRIPVIPTGEIEFPSYTIPSTPYTKDYGEVIVKPDMQVFWK